MKIAILGGDGFVGWPTALHLSDQGHDVTILDLLTPVVYTGWASTATTRQSP